MKYLFPFSFLLFVFHQSIGQAYTTQNAHSHNDYEQQAPFHLAYNEGFGSIEADIHLVDDQLLVGHDSKSLVKERTLESLYLQPIIAYNQPNRKLQLLIDIKTDAIKTIDQLVKLLCCSLNRKWSITFFCKISNTKKPYRSYTTTKFLSDKFARSMAWFSRSGLPYLTTSPAEYIIRL